jgi:hypothetical protein
VKFSLHSAAAKVSSVIFVYENVTQQLFDEQNARYVLLSDGTQLRETTRQNLFQSFGGIYLFI